MKTFICVLLLCCVRLEALSIPMLWHPSAYLKNNHWRPSYVELEKSPYWLKAHRIPLASAKPIVKTTAVISDKAVHLIQVAKGALEHPWDMVLKGKFYRLGVKFGRDFNGVLDQMHWVKVVDDTATIQPLTPQEESLLLLLPLMTFGLRFDF